MIVAAKKKKKVVGVFALKNDDGSTMKDVAHYASLKTTIVNSFCCYCIAQWTILFNIYIEAEKVPNILERR